LHSTDSLESLQLHKFEEMKRARANSLRESPQVMAVLRPQLVAGVSDFVKLHRQKPTTTDANTMDNLMQREVSYAGTFGRVSSAANTTSQFPQTSKKVLENPSKVPI
jgi:hypothetical protein